MTPPVGVEALALLDDSERLWSAAPVAALTCDGSPDSVDRRRLVLRALAALDARHAADGRPGDEHAVLARWPAVTVVALSSLAATAADRAAFGTALAAAGATSPAGHWAAGWLTCWESVGTPVGPGVLFLLALARPGVAEPRLRLDVDRRVLIVEGPDGSVTAGGLDCPPTAGGHLLQRQAPYAVHRDVLGDLRRVPLLPPGERMAVFDADGVLLPRGRPLPGAPVWLLHLGEPAPEAFDGSLSIIEVAGAPLGWNRWWLGLVSLDGVARVRSAVRSLVPGGPTLLGEWRAVEAAATLYVEPGTAVHGLLDDGGAPVFSTPPVLHLQTGRSWTVDVSGPGVDAHRTLPDGGRFAVADVLPELALGRFTACATAGGRRRAEEFTLAPGLRVDCVPRVRLLRDGDLGSAKLTFHPPAGLDAPRPFLRLTRADLAVPVTLRTADAALVVRAELPHCALRVRREGVEGEWRTRTVALDVDDCVDAAVDVRLPATVRDALTSAPTADVRTAGGTVVRKLTGHFVNGGAIARYELAPLVDTLRNRGSARIELVLPQLDVAVIAELTVPDPEPPPVVTPEPTDPLLLDPLPLGVDAFPELFERAMTAVTEHGDAGRSVAQRCAERLAEQPVEALFAAGATVRADVELTPVLLRAGLAAHHFSSVDDPRRVAVLAHRAPLAAVLLTSPLLPRLVDPRRLDNDERYLLRILTGRVPTIVDALRTGGSVPDTMLFSAPSEAVGDGPADDEIVEHLGLLQRFTTYGSPLHRHLTDPRRSPAELLSLGYALLARLTARGDSTAADLEPAVRPAAVRLAELDAAGLANDLVRAEMIVSSRWSR